MIVALPSLRFLPWIALLDLSLSIVAFTLYGWDKAAAKRYRGRVSERTLQLVALFGGWPGALLAQKLFRHKTQKRSFRRAFWGTIVANVALSMLLLSWLRR